MANREVNTVGELTPTVFFDYALAGMQELIDALVDDAAIVHGHEFNRSDVKWLETTPNGNYQQQYQLRWKNWVLLEIQFCQPSMRFQTRVAWNGRRH